MPTTVRDELARGAALLSAAGVDTPRLDAELLLGEAMGVDRARLVIAARDELADPVADRYHQLLGRRREREPVAYILGRRAFRNLELRVDRRVLIPRPETELLVEVGLQLGEGAAVLDVGTGSGAVALALKDERPDLSVTGADVSSDALDVARANGRRLGLDVRWVHGDLLEDRGYDAVLANLPYVESGAVLDPEIAGYEPPMALYGGPDGLAVVRRLVTAVGEATEVSTVALEIGTGQAEAVAGLLDAAGFRALAPIRDLGGHERVIVGRR